MNEKIICLGEVVSVDDPLGAGRIQVRLKESYADRVEDVKGNSKSSIDPTNPETELDYCYPALPGLIHILPKVGEMVLTFLSVAGNTDALRFWFGPVISRPYDTEYSDINNAKIMFPGSTAPEGEYIDTIPASSGATAKDNDIAIYGRNNTDIILTDKSIKLRCGSRKVKNNSGETAVEFNTKNPSYIRLGYSNESRKILPDFSKVQSSAETQDASDYIEQQSTAAIVADQIMFIGNNGIIGKDDAYNKVTDVDDLISENTLSEITKTCHPLPYGDSLVEFLKLFLKMFKEHSHRYPGMPTILPKGSERFWDYDLDAILSKSIRIN